MPDDHQRHAFWRANLKLVATLLFFWFAVSFGCGILLVDVLDEIRFGGFGLGFWFAQQGAIYSFLAIIIVYIFAMGRLERRYGYHDE